MHESPALLARELRRQHVDRTRVDAAVKREAAPAESLTGARQLIEHRQLVEMREVYSRTGGLSGSVDVLRRMRTHYERPVSTMTTWIASAAIVAIRARWGLLVPLFQFDLTDMSPDPNVARVLREFKGVFDQWEQAYWFTRPNSWIKGAAPAEVIRNDAAAVLDAARADRFIAVG
jgi:hypothetical protein